MKLIFIEFANGIVRIDSIDFLSIGPSEYYSNYQVMITLRGGRVLAEFSNSEKSIEVLKERYKSLKGILEN